MKKLILLLLLGCPLFAQTSLYLLPLYNGGSGANQWTYFKIGPAITITPGIGGAPGTINVPVTTGPQGPAGPIGAAGPAGPIGATGPQGTQGIQGPPGPSGSTAFPVDDLYSPTTPLASVTLKCLPADIHRNGIRQTVGKDFTLSGLVATFLTLSIPQAGDGVQVGYRCAP